MEIFEAGYGREVMYAYGRALGRLHALSSGYVPVVRKREHKGDPGMDKADFRGIRRLQGGFYRAGGGGT